MVYHGPLLFASFWEWRSPPTDSPHTSAVDMKPFANIEQTGASLGPWSVLYPPRKITWNLKIMLLKRKSSSKPSFLASHVSFRGCIWTFLRVCEIFPGTNLDHPTKDSRIQYDTRMRRMHPRSFKSHCFNPTILTCHSFSFLGHFFHLH